MMMALDNVLYGVSISNLQLSYRREMRAQNPAPTPASNSLFLQPPSRISPVTSVSICISIYRTMMMATMTTTMMDGSPGTTPRFTSHLNTWRILLTLGGQILLLEPRQFCSVSHSYYKLPWKDISPQAMKEKHTIQMPAMYSQQTLSIENWSGL